MRRLPPLGALRVFEAAARQMSFKAAAEIESGLLVQPFEVSVESYCYDLVYSPRAAERPATLVLRDWVQREFGVKPASGKLTT